MFDPSFVHFCRLVQNRSLAIVDFSNTSISPCPNTSPAHHSLWDNMATQYGRVRHRAPLLGLSHYLCRRLGSTPLPLPTAMDRLASPVRRRPPSSSPVPPLLKLLSRRPVSPLIVLIIFGMSLLLWSFSFWPLLSMKQAPIRTNNVDRCPVCPPNPQRSRPPTTDAAVESGFYTHNLTLFHKPMHTFRGT